MNNKILTFIVKDNKFLLLKGSDTDPQFKESFWYVVTGGVEDIDNTLIDTVKREVYEETNLIVNDIKYLNMIFRYEYNNIKYNEYVFVSSYESGNIKLNEESIDYKWCPKEEVLELMKWYDTKDKLELILNSILAKSIPYEQEKIFDY